MAARWSLDGGRCKCDGQMLLRTFGQGFFTAPPENVEKVTSD